MRILLLNQDWFQTELRSFGHEVVSVGLANHLDYCIEAPLVTLQSIVDEAMDGINPDVIVILDNSAPVYVMGLEETAIPVLFYSVDAHHHAELHSYLGKVFDYLLVAQSEYIEGMAAESTATMEWMPLWASRYIEPIAEKENGAVFVGSLNKRLNPERVEFFERLERVTPIRYQQGEFWEIFPRSEIVINQTVRGDLNFRVFEAMMSGALLLTERSGNRLFELFQEEVHLVTYEKNNVDEAAAKIRYWLDRPDEARKIGAAGRAEILAAHLPIHRARRIQEICEQLKGKKLDRPQRYIGWMVNCNSLALRLASLDTTLCKKALFYGVQAAEAALRSGERLNQNTVFPFVHLCSEFDLRYSSDAGSRLLETAVELNTGMPLVGYAYLRTLLNSGQVEQAKELARRLSPLPEVETFANAERIVTALLVEGEEVKQDEEFNSVKASF